MLANIFGTSPVQPLEAHIDLCHRSVSLLSEYFAAVFAEDWTGASRIRDDIESLEHEADALKKEIRLHLPKSLFMPVPRQDLLELLMVQDKIANRTLDVANTVLVRNMPIPEALRPGFSSFVDLIVATSAQARTSVRELDELFSSGFRGAEASLVESMIGELDRMETDTERQRYVLFREIHAIEAELDPVHTMFLYRTVELSGEIANMAQRVGRRLELLLSN
ncbi:MAG: TIGR00153 family protein [Pseudomonadota bacterium]